MEKPIENTQWLIWSIEHNAWWSPNSAGYIKSRAKAGRYSFKEARQIVRGANIGREREPQEAMILDEESE